MSEGTWDANSFIKNQERLLKRPVATSFFTTLVQLAKNEGSACQEHFTADGTLIEAWPELEKLCFQGKSPKQ
ncbi:MAG: Mobile element protein [Verrucomicrobiales bacterium]|nr:Mobile element protein [Verrucomicrobiales bacterium]